MADELWTVLKVLGWTQQRFRERGIASPRLDAELLLAEVLHLDRVGLYTHYDQPLSKGELSGYRELIKRRLAGEPVAYLLGRQEFWSLLLHVDRRVLVPRPETEGVVEAVLELLREQPAPRVADIGTGSGAIAIAIAHERPDARVIAVDVSAEALAVAHSNTTRLGVAVELRQGDLVAPLAGEPPFTAIAANLPYVADTDFAMLMPEVRCEPRQALLAGPDGLTLIRRLIEAAPPLLLAGGALVLEIGAGQAQAVVALAEAAGFDRTQVRKDLAGIDRVCVLQR